MSLQAGTNQHKQAARSGKLEHLQYKRNYLLLVRRQSIHSNYIQMSAAAAAAANVMTAESNNKEHYFRQLVCSFAALVTIRGSFVASMPICFACPSVRPSCRPFRRHNSWHMRAHIVDCCLSGTQNHYRHI